MKKREKGPAGPKSYFPYRAQDTIYSFVLPFSGTDAMEASTCMLCVF
jgi:hypothetical protein